MQNLSIKTKIMRVINASVFVLIFILLSNQAFAIEYGGFGGRPAFPRLENSRTESIFVHTLNPGDVQKEGVMVVNNSAEQKTILVYAVDSTPSTDGAFACEQLSQKKDNVGAWINLEKTEVTLQPATNEIVPFTITVPQNASVGEHNGCIIMQEKLDKSDNQSGVSLSFRTGLRVAITIPGELERKLEIVGFEVAKKEDGNFLLQPKVKNLGNVSIDAEAKVITRYFFGLKHMTHGGQYPILRDDTSDWNFELKKPFWGGLYRSSLIVEYDTNSEAGVGVRSGKELTLLKGPAIWFWSFPTLGGFFAGVAILLFLIGVGFLVRFLRKHEIRIKIGKKK